MTSDSLDYDELVQDALRTVVRRVLGDVARQGLPGAHHFYIAFRTAHPGVVLAPALRERYPDEMTIVLHHQFWDLAVDEDTLSVTLSFNRVSERLTVPFAALTSFIDPSVPFGLRFREGLVKPSKTDAPFEASPAPLPVAEVAPPPAPSPSTEAASDNVVRLDRFRKS